MHKHVCIFLVVMLGLLLFQCSNSTAPVNNNQPPDRTPAQLTANEKTLLESSNRFGLKLFQRVNAEEPSDKNLFLSPLSVSYALGMTLNGAAGATFDSMAATLEQAGLSLTEINEAYNSLEKILENADPSVVFNIANSIWSREDKEIKPLFIRRCGDYFDAVVRVMDFPEPADTINQWVDVNTNGKIKDIVSSPLSPDIALLILNAIYFKGDWCIPFDTSKSINGKFHTAAGTTVDCRFMVKASDEDTTLRYYKNELFRAVTIPYGNKGFCMSLFLPEGSFTVDDIIGQMTASNWTAWLEGFCDDYILVIMPRFKFEYEIVLNRILQALGMEIAFNSSLADFTNMFVDGIGWIDQVKHKTFVQVDEKGTEAAAVTSVSLIDVSFMPLAFDRPFLFVIHEQTSHTILFIGKITEPKWQD
ncbi:MAG: serpin family protein [candidate division Zixibacteria bacterium]|nr:serpin family protein [candidate division Zixibacteria bacterium]MDD5426076.1 serpin family protein [candidate division Zixibacteria bacterium]